jgi:polyhydroxybutyrate depolymerase
VDRTSRSRLRGFARWRVLAVVITVAAIAAPAAWLATAAQPDSVRVVAGASGLNTSLASFSFDGTQRHYRMFVPPRGIAGRRALLLVLHPLGGSAARFEAQAGLDRRAGAVGAVVVYPDGLGHSWNAGTCCSYGVRRHVDDVRFLTRVVADVERRVAVDPARVAVTGFSNGALMAYRLVCERPDVFPVAVAVAGDAVGPRCNPAHPVSVLHVHGGRDGVIPLSGMASSPIDAAGFPPAAASIERIAVADQCTDATTTMTAPGPQWSATGCSSGVAVELRTIANLNHHYPAGAADRARFGIDMSTLTWQFVSSAWASR